MHYQHIPVFARFQWLNHPQVVDILGRLLRPPARGRKGYDKVMMFRWLIYKQLMTRCTYRDLESMTGVDYSTFIKFRKRLSLNHWFHAAFATLVKKAVNEMKKLNLVLDSSFVETYSKRNEPGSEYFGYKKKNGFKLHTIIDYESRLPLVQFSTPGARADVVWGANLIRAAPAKWRVKSVVADKGYDSEAFVQEIKAKWKKVKVGIPVRRTNQEKVAGHPDGSTTLTTGGWLNRFLKMIDRTLTRGLLNTRGEVERYYSRKKNVFCLGEERTRGLKNFEVNCYLTSIMEHLEYIARLLGLFTKLVLHDLTNPSQNRQKHQ